MSLKKQISQKTRYLTAIKQMIGYHNWFVWVLSVYFVSFHKVLVEILIIKETFFLVGGSIINERMLLKTIK